MKILSVVGARPNFMKISPFIKAINEHNKRSSFPFIEHLLLHTGQHYDARMSQKFFSELNIPEPDINLGIGSGTHAEQVGQTMILFEKVLINYKPDWVIVVGDVNATLACSITSKKEWFKCAHIEAGLRSGDLKMPEEINRIVTDHLCDLLFTTDAIANDNLIKEGIPPEKIRFVGNIMIDTLEQNREVSESYEIMSIVKENILNPESNLIINDGKYALVTLHRPSNVDDKPILTQFIDFLSEIVTRDLNIIWPIHPRTYKNIQIFNLLTQIKNNSKIILTHPLGYLEMLRLNMGAKIVMTDSGGLQEECTILGTPCLTFRNNTERPITLRQNGGASELVGNSFIKIKEAFLEALLQEKMPFKPELWDGKTASRIVAELINFVKE